MELTNRILKVIFISGFSLIANYTYSQNSLNKYVPIMINFLSQNKIPIEDTLDRHTWINILNYSWTNPREADLLYKTNKTEYFVKVNKKLFSRKECDSIVNYFVNHNLERFKYNHSYGKGAFYVQDNSGDRSHIRCICLPGKELMDIGHGSKRLMGYQHIYLEPRDFHDKFYRFKLDTLDLEDAPYYSIFPLDIQPSFDCSKATSAIEKAICRDSTLANLDYEMSKVYRKALKNNLELVKSQQIKWIEERNDKNKDLIGKILINNLISMYKKRMLELRKY
ncbi:MAG: hypothetical protein H7329_14645 [Opitutaceae bacterium]|nr:hypothetical protein [Cytophagales bacterium]